MKTTWQNEPKQSTEIIQSEHKYVFSLCVCVCVCVHQGYRSQSTSTGWQWTSGSGIETLWNIHEEIYTCFQVTEAGILNRDAESTLCVCVMCVCVWCVCAPVWAHARTAQLPSSTCSDAPRGRKQLSTPQSQTYSDEEEHYETVRPSVLNDSPPPTLSCRADWEVPAWKTGQRWPNWVEPEAGSGALAEGWTTEAYRGLFLPECRASVCAKMNPMWKVYKSKVMKTINPEYEEDAAEEVRDLQGFAASYARIKCWEVDGGCWHPKSESQQIIFYSSRGQTSSISCSVCCAKRTFRE